MLYHENLRKVGILIRFHRRKKRKMHKIGFTQEDFIVTTQNHPFFEVDCGQPVCSRKTLCQLENGKYIQEESLYRFFLGKLGLNYTFSSHQDRMFAQLFQHFDEVLCFGEIMELVNVNPIPGDSRNVIYDFYRELYHGIQCFYVDATIPSQDFLIEVLTLWSIVPTILKPHLRLILIVSHILRRDVCQRDIKTILDFTSKHPIDLWIDAVCAVLTGRVTFCETLLKRIKSLHPTSQWLTYLTHQLRTFVIVSQQGRPLKDVASIPQTLPIFKLGNRILLSRLGNDAVKRQAFIHAKTYLSSITDPPDMLGLHAALYLREPVNIAEVSDMSRNHKILVKYLSMDIETQAHVKLDYLMSHLLPIVEPQDRYTKTCLFRDLQYLVTQTRKYKCLHECAEFLQLTHEPEKEGIKA